MGRLRSLRAQCEAEIASHHAEEATILAGLENALSTGDGVSEEPRSKAGLGLTQGWTDELLDTAVALTRQVEDGRHVAERVSSGVRHLDAARLRAQRAITIAEALANLRALATRAAVRRRAGPSAPRRARLVFAGLHVCARGARPQL